MPSTICRATLRMAAATAKPCLAASAFRALWYLILLASRNKNIYATRAIAGLLVIGQSASSNSCGALPTAERQIGRLATTELMHLFLKTLDIVRIMEWA